MGRERLEAREGVAGGARPVPLQTLLSANTVLQKLTAFGGAEGERGADMG